MKYMDTIEVFNSLQLPNWSVLSKLKSGGQADVLFLINPKTNDNGVFRLLRSNREIDVIRFKREIGILTNPKYYHPNLVKVLEYSKDNNHFWYISEKGDDFQLYWEKIKTDNQLNPNKIVSIGLEICLNLLRGLEVLHFQNVVHRDIKPANIVIVNKEPVLIDFGLAFVEEEERVSPENSAVGNAKFSPSEMMWPMDEIPPWLDIFMVSQLLIWMLSEKPIKDHWFRPLDWRWVKYLDGVSAENNVALRALTALCSEQTSSPKNATELIILIDNLFHSNSISNSNKNIQEIVLKVKQGKSKNIIISSEIKSMLIASFPILEILVYKIRNYLLSLEVSDYSGINVKLVEYDFTLSKWEDSIFKSTNFENIEKALNPFSLKCSIKDSSYFFQIAVNIDLVFDKDIKSDFLPFLVKLVFGTNKDNLNRFRFENEYIVNREFQLFLTDGNNSSEISEEDFFDLINNTIFNNETWEELLKSHKLP